MLQFLNLAFLINQAKKRVHLRHKNEPLRLTTYFSTYFYVYLNQTLIILLWTIGHNRIHIDTLKNNKSLYELS